MGKITTAELSFYEPNSKSVIEYACKMCSVMKVSDYKLHARRRLLANDH